MSMEYTKIPDGCPWTWIGCQVVGSMNESAFLTKNFQLRRVSDESGVSGIGVVAVGVVFQGGKCVLAWMTEHKSIAVYDDIETLMKIHGHGGKTVLEWLTSSDGVMLSPEGNPVHQKQCPCTACCFGLNDQIDVRAPALHPKVSK